MDLLFSYQGVELMKNFVLTFPSLAYNVINKQVYGVVRPEGYIYHHGVGDTPLVLIPGRTGNAVDFDTVVTYLRDKHLFPHPIVVITPSENHLISVADEAVQVHRILELLNYSCYNVIGHSKGGIVAHYLQDNIPKSYTIKKVISVVSPHLGTPVTRFVGGLAELDLGVECPTVQLLRTNHGQECYYYVGNVLDHLVPPESAIPKAAKPTQTLLMTDYRGHALLTSESLIIQLHSWLVQ